MAKPDVAVANQRLQADPRFQQAWAKYQQTMAVAQRPSTTTQARNDDEMPGGTGPESPDQNAAARELGATIKPLLASYGLAGQPQAWHISPTGQLTYSEDHSLRNIGLMLGAVGGAGVASGLLGGAAAPTVATTTAGTTGGGGLSTSALALSNLNPAFAGAIPAAAGGAVVPTIAPPLITTLGITPTMMGTAGALSGVGGALGVARTVGNYLSDWEKNRQQQRSEAGLDAYRQNLASEARFRSQLEAHRDALAAPQKRASNSIRGDRLANTQEFHLNVPGIPRANSQGGFGPAQWSENTRQLGRQMSADALAGSGTDELAGPPLERAPQPNGLDTFLNTASLVSNIPYKRNGQWVNPSDPTNAMDPYSEWQQQQQRTRKP